MPHDSWHIQERKMNPLFAGNYCNVTVNQHSAVLALFEAGVIDTFFIKLSSLGKEPAATQIKETNFERRQDLQHPSEIQWFALGLAGYVIIKLTCTFTSFLSLSLFCRKRTSSRISGT